MAAEPLLEVDGLEVVVRRPGGVVERPVRGVSLSLAAGERVGLVGASGSGKSLTLLAILGLAPEPAAIAGGRVRLAGVDAARVPRFRGGEVGLVLQEAGSALNPVLSVGAQLQETIEAHGVARGVAARRRAAELLAEAALEDAGPLLDAFPHQLSGGQAQRVMIALALAGNPRVLLADEPTTALDAVTRAQILELLVRITDERGLALLLVSHDLGLIARLVHRVLVLDAGRVVESGDTDALLRDPAHPATRRLVEAANRLGGGGRA
ncbi:MAG: ABC transporter ATP-binding protein [Thermoanaerobaculales bacterium]|jgi:ABC-type glutathione transport system ATPase component|nr:ABC transporter ATP-binding protein [Thermoanaerobaculales bacterium]